MDLKKELVITSYTTFPVMILNFLGMTILLFHYQKLSQKYIFLMNQIYSLNGFVLLGYKNLIQREYIFQITVIIRNDLEM